jgi:hypothetical protein
MAKIPHLKLLQLASPKDTKNTMNLLIDLYNSIDTEIRGIADTANANSEEALRVSNTAVTMADDAKAIASAATNTANAALNTANTAVNTAGTALDAAEEAIQAANNAVTISAQAQTTATRAQELASAADQKSDNAVATANNTIAIAQNAENKAAEAVSTSNTALELARNAQDYNKIANRPSIAGVELIGNKPLTDFGIASTKYVDDSIAAIEIPSTEGLASEEFVNQKIAELLGSAPDELNTLKELADAIKESETALEGINTILASKADKTALDATNAAVAQLRSDLDNLDIPDAPTKLSQLENDRGFITNADIPTKVSTFTNDAGYITTAVNTLANYYTKAETYTRTEISDLIANTEVKVDLSDYYKKTETYSQSELNTKFDLKANQTALATTNVNVANLDTRVQTVENNYYPKSGGLLSGSPIIPYAGAGLLAPRNTAGSQTTGLIRWDESSTGVIFGDGGSNTPYTTLNYRFVGDGDIKHYYSTDRVSATVLDTKNFNSHITFPDTSGFLPLTAGSSKKLTGTLLSSENIILDNTKSFQIKNTGGTAIDMIRFNASNQIILGSSQTKYDLVSYVNIRPTAAVATTLGTEGNPWSMIYGTNIYQNGKPVANKEDLNSYLRNDAAGTISISGSDTPLNLRSSAGNVYLGFIGATGAALGYIGVNANKRPVFYDTKDNQLAFLSDIPSFKLLSQSEYAAETLQTGLLYFVEED